MKKVVLCIALFGLCCAPAMADIVKAYDTSRAALAASVAPQPRDLPSVTGFEPAEGFAPGYVNLQAGWTTFSASDAEGHIDTANPAAGVQHLRISDDPAAPDGSLTGGFSPDQGLLPAGQYSVSVDVAIGASGGADYDVIPQAPSQEFLSARVKFSWLGDILVLDDIGAGLEFVDTDVDWVEGAYTNLAIDLDADANTIDYYYGGSLIYSSVAGVYAGTSIEQVVLASDNYQFGEHGDFDNLVITPEPASLALLGLGGLAMLRRRR